MINTEKQEIGYTQEEAIDPREALEQTRLLIAELQKKVDSLSLVVEHFKPGIKEKISSAIVGDVLLRSDGRRDIVIVQPTPTGKPGEVKFSAFVVSQEGGIVKRITEESATNPYVDLAETPILSENINFDDIHTGDTLISASGTVRMVLEKHQGAIVCRRIKGSNNITTETTLREKFNTAAIIKTVKAKST
ncbi:MAG: hypothetical protein BroJett025_03320 [Patescibacteria group bacterium]|nr:MAG: hypothetical protein BroJett025_03320 [Patescibacteria group bacterium]